jgi:hypothetical protein
MSELGWIMIKTFMEKVTGTVLKTAIFNDVCIWNWRLFLECSMKGEWKQVPDIHIL